ncbi:MAG: chorismate synthase [Firmicutes bacterium]|nr:chorismate synthase [Bacillota bacterium]
MNSFGRLFRVSLYGESHGSGVGVVVDGCPAGLPLREEDFEADLARRRSGAKGTTTRREADAPRIVSGVFEGRTTGAPLCLHFENGDVRSGDYEALRHTPRPGHADLVARQKFAGFNDPRGGGHFSGRLTVALTAAGVVAKKLMPNITIHAELKRDEDFDTRLEAAIREGDSLGGLVECWVTGLPTGLGEPFFDSVESVLSHLIFAIPAVKGVEFGAGFAVAQMRGSQCNDAILDAQGTTRTQHAGGLHGGLSDGNPLTLRVAVKPTSSIARPQDTVDLRTGQPARLELKGRHDACIALRIPPVLEGAVALGLVDLLAQNGGLGQIWGQAAP